jgi:hypothetical protein
VTNLYGLGTIFRDDTGQCFFYPYGPLGRGYRLAPEREEDVYEALRRACLLLLAGIAAFVASYFTAWALIDPLSSIFGTIGPVFVVLGIAYLLWMVSAFERVTSRLPRSNLPKKQVLRLSARNTPWAVLLIQPLLIGWAMFNQLSSVFQANGAQLVGVIFIAAFWLALASLVGHQIWVKLIDRPALHEN